MAILISVCDCMCLCAFVISYFTSELKVYSVALKFHCHYIWITAVCYLPPSWAFWSTVYVLNVDCGQTHILHTKWKNVSCPNIYIFFNYNDQHTGTTYRSCVVSLIIWYLYSVGCWLMAYKQESNIRKVVDYSHSSPLPNEDLIPYANQSV